MDMITGISPRGTDVASADRKKTRPGKEGGPVDFGTLFKKQAKEPAAKKEGKQAAGLTGETGPAAGGMAAQEAQGPTAGGGGLVPGSDGSMAKTQALDGTYVIPAGEALGRLGQAAEAVFGDGGAKGDSSPAGTVRQAGGGTEAPGWGQEAGAAKEASPAASAAGLVRGQAAFAGQPAGEGNGQGMPTREGMTQEVALQEGRPQEVVPHGGKIQQAPFHGGDTQEAALRRGKAQEAVSQGEKAQEGILQEGTLQGAFRQAGLRTASSGITGQAQPHEEGGTVRLDTNPAMLAGDLGDKLYSRLIQKKGEMTVELEPATLGKLTIRVVYDAGRAAVSIAATNPRTLEILNQRAGELAGILEQKTGQPTVVYTQPAYQDQGQQYPTDQGGREDGRQHQPQEDRKKQEADSFMQQLRLGLA